MLSNNREKSSRNGVGSCHGGSHPKQGVIAGYREENCYRPLAFLTNSHYNGTTHSNDG